VVTTMINVIGIAFANKVNLILMAVQLSVLATLVILAARYVMAASGPGGLVSATPFFKAEVPFSASVAGAAIAAYSFLGFDAVSTLTEETKDAKRTMPRAILIIALAGGLIFVGSSYITQLAHPSIDFVSIDAAASEIAMMIGGDIFVTFFLATLVVAQFTSGLAAIVLWCFAFQVAHPDFELDTCWHCRPISIDHGCHYLNLIHQLRCFSGAHHREPLSDRSLC